METPSWQWDNRRQEWYYVNLEDNTYTYHSGIKIPIPGAVQSENIPSQAAVEDPSRGNPGHAPSIQSIGSETLSLPSPNPRALDHQGPPLFELMLRDQHFHSTAKLEKYPRSLNIPSSSYGTPNPEKSKEHSEPEGDSGDRPDDHTILNYVQRNVSAKDSTENTQPELLESNPGISAHQRLYGSSGNSERLDPNYRKLYPAKEHFKTGFVFRVLWPELAGDALTNMTIVTNGLGAGEKLYVKVRWFVVVREGENSCTCLSIQTYGRKGVANKVKKHHAIIYTSSEPPKPLPSELPEPWGWEEPMSDPIRVIPFKSSENMDSISRVNFAKLYTVEHNVKVSPFGSVAPGDEWKFIAQFNRHWDLIRNARSSSATREHSVAAGSSPLPSSSKGSIPATQYNHSTARLEYGGKAVHGYTTGHYYGAARLGYGGEAVPGYTTGYDPAPAPIPLRSTETKMDDASNESRSTALKSILDSTSQSNVTTITPFTTSSTPKKISSNPVELEQMLDVQGVQDEDTYSDSGSIADYEETYSNTFRNELLQDLISMDLTDHESELSLLLEEFAIRIGHQGESQDHQTMMYVAHKHRRKIAKKICGNFRGEDGHSTSGSDGSEKSNGPTYYSDMRNIQKWNSENDGEDPDSETHTAETDPWEEKLRFGHEALRASEAYKWLVSAIQKVLSINGAEHSRNRSRRLEFLTILPQDQARISRQRRPALYTTKFELPWDIIGFLKGQEYAEELHTVVGRVITLTGDDQAVQLQALGCEEYIKQIWPTTGPHFVRLLERLVQNPTRLHEEILPDKTRIMGTIHEDGVFFEMTGTRYGLAEAADQLLWVSTALQSPTDSPRASLSFTEVTGTFAIDYNIQRGPATYPVSGQHIGTAQFKVKFKNKSLDQKDHLVRGHCWHNLFRHSVIVSGYPIPSRPAERPGLELPFDMMASLAGAERVTTFGSNLVVKGFSTLLYPTMLEDGFIFWHLIHNEDGSRISFADNRVAIPVDIEPTLLQLRPDDVDDSRHIVGWAPTLRKNTGTIDANYNIRWSALSRPSAGFALQSVQISAGKYISLSGTFARGKREKAVYTTDQDYDGRLRSLGDRFILLHDIEVRKVWLVDGLSALLHLMRANLTYDSEGDYGAAALSKPESLQAKGSHTGRKMAYQTLSHASNMKLRLRKKVDIMNEEGEEEKDKDFYCLVDAVKYIMHILEQMLDHQEDERAESSVGYRVRTSPWKQMEGFDFMDIATKSNLIWPKSTTLRVDGEGWVGFSRAIRAVTLFGKGFGELLEPFRAAGDQNHCTTCCWNSNVPAQRDVLAVSVSDLERVVERHGVKSDVSWRLVEDFHLNISPELFSTCSRNGRYGCHQRIQKILLKRNHDAEQKAEGQKVQKGSSTLISRMSHRYKQTTSAGKSPASLDISSGGILLGSIPNRLKKPQTSRDPGRQVSTKQKGPAVNVAKSRQIRQSSLGKMPISVLSASSSSQITTQRSSQTLEANSEGTNITEPSVLESQASPVNVMDGKKKNKLENTSV